MFLEKIKIFSFFKIVTVGPGKKEKLNPYWIRMRRRFSQKMVLVSLALISPNRVTIFYEPLIINFKTIFNMTSTRKSTNLQGKISFVWKLVYNSIRWENILVHHILCSIFSYLFFFFFEEKKLLKKENRKNIKKNIK